MRPRHLALFTLASLTLAAVAAGCEPHLIVGGLGNNGGNAGSPGFGGGSSTCPSARGPAMVRIEAPGNRSYCIDTTEVTQAHYQAFLDAHIEPGSTSPLCSYKTTFSPGAEPLDPDPSGGQPQGCHAATPHFDPSSTPDLPVVCVDFCDAQAYCAWSGKRLCGHIGGGGTFDESGDASANEWYRACSSAGTSAFPYGDDFVTGACTDGADTAAVASKPACRAAAGPYAGIFDMSGNVAEWENNCNDSPGGALDGGAGIICSIRGGAAGDHHASADDQQRFACDPKTGGHEFDDFNYQRPKTGIRCCAD